MISQGGWFWPPYKPVRYHLGRLAKGARTRFILLKDKAGHIVASAAIGPGRQFSGYKHIFRLLFSERSTDAYFDHIFIKNAYQHRGLGRWFTAVLTQQAKDMGFKRMIADCITPTSTELLKKMGYEEILRFKNHAYMTKSLVDPTLTPPTKNV